MSAPSHHVPLAGGWAIWKWVCIKGAGFPVSDVLALAAPETARAIDELLDLEAQLERATGEVIAAGEQAMRAADGDRKKAWQRVLKRLRTGAPGETPPLPGEPPDGLAALSILRQRVAALRAAVAERFRLQSIEVAVALRDAARRPLFREALVWQNRKALHGTIEALLQTPPTAGDSDTRRRELVVASYLQRYCTKNETVGFFGPVAWGSHVSDGPPLRLRGGPLIAHRAIYLEIWAAEALAARLAEDPELKPHLAPRRLPTVRIEGEVLHTPVERTTVLPSEFARLLAACDGRKSARSIAEELLADPSLELEDHDAVYALLDELRVKKLVTWTIELPIIGAHPERNLRCVLESLEVCPARARALAALDELDQARDAVSAAAGEAAQLDVAIGRLEEIFERLTGTAPTRGSGVTARTPFFEECRRGVELELGPAYVQRLARPLALVLQSARWYTFTIAARYRALFESVHRRLSDEAGSPTIDYVRFFHNLEEHFSGDAYVAPPIVREVAAEVQRRWAEVLRLDPALQREQRGCDQIAAAVGSAFAAPHPGWPAARHHSPDIAVAAAGPDAFRRGEFQLVLNECHTGYNTIRSHLFLDQHSASDEVHVAHDVDISEPSIATIILSTRAYRSFSPRDFDLEVGATRSGRPTEKVIAIADLVVDSMEGRLVVRTRDRRHVFDILVFFERHPRLESASSFSVLGGAAHLPRVTLDGLVVSRERWRFDPEELGFARAGTPFERFAGARRFARARGLPRFLFAKIPEEPKPFYVDLESPPLVEILARLTRKATQVSMSEMLPTPEQTWLTDADGQRYTSELRTIAVDPEPWRAP